MNDGDSLRHLLDSPIDDDPKRPRESETTSGAPSWFWLVGAMLVGGLLVLAGYLVGGNGTGVVVAEDTTTTTVPVTDTGFPAGFVPLDSRFGARVERVLFSPDGVYVTVSTVSTFSIEGEASAFVGGGWDLILADGTRISSVDQASDALVPGYLTVRFDPAGYGPDDIEAIQHTALGVATGEDASLTVPGVVLPEDGSAITLDDEVEHRGPDGTILLVRHFELSRESGKATWALAGDEATQAQLSVHASAVTAGGATHFMVGSTGQEGFIGGFGFGTFAIQHGAWQTGGDIGLAVPGDDGPLPAGEPLDLVLSVSITWLSFSPVDAPPIPVDDAPVTVVE